MTWRSLALATLTVILEAGTIARVNSPRPPCHLRPIARSGGVSRLSSCGGAYPYHSFPAHLDAHRAIPQWPKIKLNLNYGTQLVVSTVRQFHVCRQVFQEPLRSLRNTVTSVPSKRTSFPSSPEPVAHHLPLA